MIHKILSDKEKFCVHNSSELFLQFIRQFSDLELGIATDKDHLSEDETQIKTLREKISRTKDKITKEDNKNRELVENVCTYEKTIKMLQGEFNCLKIENQSAISSVNKLKRKIMNPNRKDQEILERGKKKLNYYKVLSGIRWDYPELKNSVKGYITNRDEYIHAFCFDRETNKYGEKLWLEVGKGSLRLKETEIQQLVAEI
ncbi:hypothetical protein HCN44_008616 [Aphidius gifuensis]|uniref:Uncharacterized protein n=1 Tax=Aphidius gifuensis TaxID=684658 RepID=A0A835CN69_APHGI|nr:uncharacterized protein LOC122858354 [Aphidius gifuensis]KAF7989942.1 hypothetical protein HCN44_008616 [Aphidius gifuensis]